ncbi:MAG: TolC family protein, partial [Solirubrobacteraceae bacterium]
RAQIAAEQARTARAYAEYRKTVLGALADADNALGAFTAEQRRRADLVAAVETSRRAVATATDLYREGVADYLSVLDAQRSLAAAEDNLAQGDRANATDLVALYKSLGGHCPMTTASRAPTSSHQPTTHS